VGKDRKDELSDEDPPSRRYWACRSSASSRHRDASRHLDAELVTSHGAAADRMLAMFAAWGDYPPSTLTIV
jgi:hypothetical protein